MSISSKVDLPERRLLPLVRADLSAREAVALIVEHANSSIRRLPAFLVSIAGPADLQGRLHPQAGMWDVRFVAPEPGYYVCGSLAAGGFLSFSLHQMWGPPPLPFEVTGEWMDSTAAAERVRSEPVLPGMVEPFSLFLSMQRVEEVGLAWDVRRFSVDAASRMSYAHSFGVNASDGELAAETVEVQRAGKVVESRSRTRLDGDGEWVDRMAAR